MKNFKVTYLRKSDSQWSEDGYGRHEVYCDSAQEALDCVAELQTEFGNKEIEALRWSESDRDWSPIETSDDAVIAQKTVLG